MPVLLAAASIFASNVQNDATKSVDNGIGCTLETRLNPATLAYLNSLPVDQAKEPAAANGYVRIVAKYTACPVPDDMRRDYKNEKRNMLHRFFMHKLVNKSLNVNVSVRPIGVSATKTLIQIGRDSGKQGENWSTDVGNSLTILPYFRVEPNTTIELNATYVSNRSYLSSIASDTLDVLDRATSLITPTTPLITASNKGRFNDASTFVDSTVNGMLKVEMKETLRSDSPLRLKDQELARLVLYTTGANDPYSRKPLENSRPVGQWIISANQFNGSLFSGVDNKQTIPSAASVLNFLVTDNKRLREVLGGDSTIANARDAVFKASTKENVGALCRLVASRADAEGFSAHDVARVVAAYIYDMSPTADTSAASWMGCGQIDSVKSLYALESNGPAH